MTKRIRFYLNFYEAIVQKPLSKEEADKAREELLVQIQFFQHERLIHLIVTVLFAILTVATLYVNLFLTQPLLIAPTALLLILLVPYIKHYYLLENGVQKFYEYYDKLRDV